MLKSLTKRRFRKTVSQVLTFALLIFYIIGTGKLEIHSIFDDHAVAISHSEEQEEDPCHRTVYHDDWQKGCHHATHLIVSDKCQICDCAIHSDQSLVSSHIDSPVPYPIKQFITYKNNLDSYFAVISSSRAPPTTI